MNRTRLGATDLPTGLAILLGAASCYAAWLTQIVSCVGSGARLLLIAAAVFRSGSSTASASGSVAG